MAIIVPLACLRLFMLLQSVAGLRTTKGKKSKGHYPCLPCGCLTKFSDTMGPKKSRFCQINFYLTRFDVR